MDEPGFLAPLRIAVVGLGLMGGSLALALRGRCAGLLGFDPDPAALELARRRKVVDFASAEPAEVLFQADVVVLAAPVRAILAWTAALPDLVTGPAVVIDLGSTKAQIAQALASLPERFEVVGGHPMCGKEHLSLANADPSLYAGAVFAFTALPRTTLRARRLAEALAGAVGARALWLDPETHDRWVAATSHLPFLLASALSAGTPLEAAPLVGPGFRSAVRLAATPSTMMLDVLATNRTNLLETLQRFRESLTALEQALAGEDFPRLQALLDEAAARQKELTWN